MESYPLQLNASKFEKEESEFSAAFIIHMLNSVDFKVLHNTVTNELKLKGFPDKIPEGKLSAEEHGTFLRAVHDALVDLHVQEGVLKCSKCKREYLIQQGIPNMRLNEDEVS